MSRHATSVAFAVVAAAALSAYVLVREGLATLKLPMARRASSSLDLEDATARSSTALLRALRQRRNSLQPVPPSSESTPPPPAPPAGSSGWTWAGFAMLPTEVVREATWYDRERTLPALFEDVAEGGIVWMSFANQAFESLAYNWAAHVYMLRKERQLVLAALDSSLQAKLSRHRLPFFNFNAAGTTAADLRSNTTEFRRMGALKGELLLSVLNARRHVLLSDVDVIWLADPEPLLRTLWDADVMSATDCLSPLADEERTPPPERQRQGVNRCAYAVGNATFARGTRSGCSRTAWPRARTATRCTPPSPRAATSARSGASATRRTGCSTRPTITPAAAASSRTRRRSRRPTCRPSATPRPRASRTTSTRRAGSCPTRCASRRGCRRTSS
eukprot:Transcript_13868.p2 GENE.Transcript_13868~~Transcript_13868.p2  ORF type:complete len:415 (+),score=60.60 Transcript_13868:80-1246(+)